MTALKDLDVSWTQLSGLIPSELGRITWMDTRCGSCSINWVGPFLRKLYSNDHAGLWIFNSYSTTINWRDRSPIGRPPPNWQIVDCTTTDWRGPFQNGWVPVRTPRARWNPWVTGMFWHVEVLLVVNWNIQTPRIRFLVFNEGKSLTILLELKSSVSKFDDAGTLWKFQSLLMGLSLYIWSSFLL